MQCNGGNDAIMSDKPTETEPEKEESSRTLSFRLEEEREEEEDDDEKVLESESSKEELESSFLDSSFTSSAKEEDGFKKTKKERTRSFPKNKGSNGASHVFRNILTCGAVDTKDSAVRPRYRRGNVTGKAESNGEICRAEGLGGSWNQQPLPQNSR